MASDDVKPTRLLAADSAIADFVKKVPSRYRIALITFSNHIAVRVPPTYDESASATDFCTGRRSPDRRVIRRTRRKRLQFLNLR